MIKQIIFTEQPKTISGEKEGKSWTIYKFKNDVDGKIYSTFDELWMRKMNQHLEIEAEANNWVDKNGNQHEDFKIVADKNAGQKPSQPTEAAKSANTILLEKLFVKVNELTEKVDIAITFIKNLELVEIPKQKEPENPLL
jgi:hypothetical protein